MKTLHLSIIVGSGIMIATIFSVLYFFPSVISGTTESPEAVNLDLSNSTTENPLGIKAQIVMEVDRGIMCPTKCVIPPTPHLVLTSEKGAQFVGYQVCNGTLCKKDKLDNSLYAHLAQVPQNYSGTVWLEASHINLGNLPWSVGDRVHILVKAFPVTLQTNNVVIREPEKTMVIDLGESKIIENYSTTNVSAIIIPKDSEDQSSGKNFEPKYLVVVLGVNNTVRWINEADVPNTLFADNQDDPLFWNATHSISNGMLFDGRTFNFTFTKLGEFGYHTEPHPWLHGWVLVLPQSTENATQTVVLNNTQVPGPCQIFGVPCPNNTTFTAQKFGTDTYIEKMTINGVDHYAIVSPSGVCVYPLAHSDSCTDPISLAMLRLVGVDTSIPQKDVNIMITGLNSSYTVGQPIDFGINVKGYGPCDVPSVLITSVEGSFSWQSNAPVMTCPPGMDKIDINYTLHYLGGPLSLNQTGTYRVHVDYDSNYTETQFNVTSSDVKSKISHLTNTRTSKMVPSPIDVAVMWN